MEFKSNLAIKLNLNYSMIQDTDFSDTKIIECMAVIDIDPSLSHFKPIQQKWISSIQLYSDIPKDIKSGSKVLNLLFGLYLVINYCQKNRLPVYEIDFISQPGPQWITIKMPNNFIDKFSESVLCYKTQELELTEPLGDIDVICFERKSLFGQDKQVLNVPNGYKVVSNPIFQSFLIYKRIKSRLEQTFKPIIIQSYPQNHTTSLDLIPSFCFPEGIKLSRQLKGFITFSYILTQSSGDRIYITYLTFKELLNESLKTKLNVKGLENIYYDKGVCLISKYKFSDQLSDCLQHLYRLSMSKNDQPFFKVTQNFVNQLKIPKQISQFGFSYSYNGCNIIFQLDRVLQATSPKSIYCMFKFLPLEQILTIFKAILYERQVIFISQSKTVLGFAMEAFTSFLFPFKWQNVIIPIVPLTMKQYLNAPIPYLAGITTAQLIDLSIESQVVLVLLDQGKIMNDEDLPPLPQKMYKQLLKRLQDFELYDPEQVKEYLQNPENTYMFKMMEVQHPQFNQTTVRQAFFQFFTILMKNYKKFWKTKFFKDIINSFSIKSNQSQLISEIFKIQEFMSDLGINKVGSFGHRFTEGAIFTAFLQRRHFNPADQIANFFDDCLEKKKNKKFQGDLLIKLPKIRYLVTRHPEPEKQKRFYSYQRFPSILAEKTEKNFCLDDIKLQIYEEGLIPETQFLEFIDEESQLMNGFYEIVKGEQIKNESHLPFLNLLTNKNKELFLQNAKKAEKKGVNFYETFKQIYEIQRGQIKTMFSEWPKFSRNQIELIQLNKIEYLNKKLEKKNLGLNQQKIISVWEDENLEIIMKNSIKIILMSSDFQSHQPSRNQLKNTSLSSSSIGRFSCQTVHVYIPNFRIKAFLNRIFVDQAGQIFDFIHNKVKNGSDNVWNIETIIQLRQFLDSIYQEDQLRQDKFATDKTLSLQCFNLNIDTEEK